MKRYFDTAAALVLALAAATAASADTRQLAASAGLDANEAASLTLTEIARMKFNDGARQDDRVVLFTPGVGGEAARSQLIAGAGLSGAEADGMTLTEIAVAKRNREVGRDEGIQVVVSTRSFATGGMGGRSQLIASAGLDAEAARDMSLQQIYVAKINREGDNEQRVGAY